MYSSSAVQLAEGCVKMCCSVSTRAGLVLKLPRVPRCSVKEGEVLRGANKGVCGVGGMLVCPWIVEVSVVWCTKLHVMLLQPSTVSWCLGAA
jgi:hypothetical protein